MSELVYRKDLDRVLSSNEVDSNFESIDKKIDAVSVRFVVSYFNPSNADDKTKGFLIDSIFYNVEEKKYYKCVSNTENEAEWNLITHDFVRLIGGSDAIFANENEDRLHTNILSGSSNYYSGHLKNCIVSSSHFRIDDCKNTLSLGQDSDLNTCHDSIINTRNTKLGTSKSLVMGSDNDNVKSSSSFINVSNSEIFCEFSNIIGAKVNVYSQYVNILGYNCKVEKTDYFAYCGSVTGNGITVTPTDEHLVNFFSQGFGNILNHGRSFLYGDNLKTSAKGQFILGQFNTLDENLVFAYGNGVDEDNRSNLFEIYKDGSFIVPNLEINSDTSSKTLINKEYADYEIKNIVLGGKDVTENRPSSPKIGFYYFDTDLNKPIWYNGSDWTDATGKVV